MSNASEPPEPASQPAAQVVPWNPLAGVLYAIFIFFAAQFAAAILFYLPLAAVHHGSKSFDDQSVTSQFIYIVLAEALTVLGVYAFLRAHKSGFKAIGLRRLKGSDLGWGIIAALVYFGLFVVAAAVIGSAWHGLNVDAKQEIGFDNVQGAVPLILTFISLVVLPPITEEILVRGLLFGSLRKLLPLLGAALVTSMLFAVPHLFEGGSQGLLWVAGIDTFILSMVLCYVRQWTGGLWAGMVVHAIKNGTAFLFLFLWHAH